MGLISVVRVGTRERRRRDEDGVVCWFSGSVQAVVCIRFPYNTVTVSVRNVFALEILLLVLAPSARPSCSVRIEML
jgi:hypothetical protein